MNILMVLDSTFPHDWRVEKEALALIEGGHNVYVLSQYVNSKPVIENIHGITVLRTVKTRGGFFGILNRIIFLLSLFDVGFYWNMLHAIREYNIDVIHIHDLPLGKTGYMSAKKTKKKLVLDLHENMPEALASYQSPGRKSIREKITNVFNRFKRWKKYEKKCLEKADIIIAVIEEMKQNLLASHSELNEEKIVIVSNTEPLSFSKKEKDKDIMAKYSNAFYALYIGGLGYHRGVDTLINSSRYLEDGIKILIIGGGEKSFVKYMEAEILKLGNNNKVTYLGPQENSKGASYIAACSVGVIPHHSNPHCDNTIPHKLFHFMLEKKPLLVSSSKSLKRVVNDVNCGLVFEANNPKDLADKLNELYLSRENIVQYGDNGYQSAGNGKYCWDKDKKSLMSLYKTLA